MDYKNIKGEVAKLTKGLSPEAANDTFYSIILEKKIEQAEEAIQEGRVFTTEQVKKKSKKWLK